MSVEELLRSQGIDLSAFQSNKRNYWDNFDDDDDNDEDEDGDNANDEQLSRAPSPGQISHLGNSPP